MTVLLKSLKQRAQQQPHDKQHYQCVANNNISIGVEPMKKKSFTKPHDFVVIYLHITNTHVVEFITKNSVSQFDKKNLFDSVDCMMTGGGYV